MIRRYTNIVAVYFILYKNNMFSGNMSTWNIQMYETKSLSWKYRYENTSNKNVLLNFNKTAWFYMK